MGMYPTTSIYGEFWWSVWLSFGHNDEHVLESMTLPMNNMESSLRNAMSTVASPPDCTSAPGSKFSPEIPHEPQDRTLDSLFSLLP
jgi:hypothetical protein